MAQSQVQPLACLQLERWRLGGANVALSSFEPAGPWAKALGLLFYELSVWAREVCGPKAEAFVETKNDRLCHVLMIG